MTLKNKIESYNIDFKILGWNASYGFNVDSLRLKSNDCEYDGYAEIFSIDLTCKAKEVCKELKIDKSTNIEILIRFSDNLGADNRVGGIIKNNNSNLLSVYITLPIKVKDNFLTLLSSNKFKSVAICTEKLKYNKSKVASFYISSSDILE